MHPILFKIGPVTVYSYGTMFALGFVVAFFFICFQAIRNNIDKDIIVNLAFITLFFGIAGARLLYVTTNIGYYLSHPLEVLDFSKGGLVYYGGFFGGVAAFAYYSVRKGIGFWNAADICAPYLALTQSFGRIGCLLNGCCYGKSAPADFPFGIAHSEFSGPVYPTQIFSSILLFLTFVILRYWQGRRRFMGEIFLIYCLLYPAQRFMVEFLRGDNMQVLFGLTMSQLISAVVFACGGFIFILKAAEWQKRKISSGLK